MDMKSDNRSLDDIIKSIPTTDIKKDDSKLSGLFSDFWIINSKIKNKILNLLQSILMILRKEPKESFIEESR